MSVNQLKNQLFLFSFGLGLASSVAICQPNQNIKDLGKVALGFSSAMITAAELITGKCENLSSQSNSKYDDLLRDRDGSLISITRNLDKSLNELSNFKLSNQKLEAELQQAINTLNSRNSELTNSHKKIYQLEQKLTNVGRFSTSEAHKIVRETYERSVRKLEAHIEALARNYAAISSEFDSVLLEVDKFRNRYLNKLNEYDDITNFNDLIEIGLDMQEKIINGCIELRVKGQSKAIRYLNTLLEDSVSFNQYENDVINLQTHAGKTIQQLKDENEAQVRAVVTDWVRSNEQHIENYNTSFEEILQAGKQAVAALYERDSLITQLQAELDQLRQPWKFTGTIDYALAGNAIINFYHRAYGYTLDAMAWLETETGYTLTFGTSRNQVYLTADMLHDKDNQEQIAGLTNALERPSFTPNYQSGLVSLDIKIRRASKKDSSKDDIDKIWIPASKFESYVRRWERVRITAGSTGGKSPTAKNLALAILNSRKGVGEIRLYDPQHGSKKDYWNMPKAGTSHEDNLKGMQELCQLIDDRRHRSNHQFVLYIFDEVDNTVSTLKEGARFKDLIKISLKEGSHASVGVIYIGQSADANEVPGMTHSNWNNTIQLHIGSNAGSWIDTAKMVTTEDKTRLLDQYRKIQEYCDRKNEELGLDILTDASAYRFALAVPLTGLPKFIQLPDFDTYDYHEVMSINTQNLVYPNNLGNSFVEPKFEEIKLDVECPYCKSTNTKKNGKNKKGQQYYTCLNCDGKPKNFLETVLTNINSEEIGF